MILKLSFRKRGVNALLLLSGGLDSILAAKTLMSQKIKVTPLCFKSCFFDEKLAKKSAKTLDLKLKVCDITREHLKILRRPRFGYGKGLNPCIDCHLLMIKRAKEIMKKEKFDILATGEVLGERPFSQNKIAFKLIEKKVALENKILRPLSAKLLPETIYEKKGQVDREKLFAFQGKSRRPQIALSRKYKIKGFPTPAGGCALTDPEYVKKLKILFEKCPNFDANDCQILKRGRIFWKNKSLIVVGRNKDENELLEKMKKRQDIILEPENFPGPTVLIRGFRQKVKRETLEKAEKLLLKYSKRFLKIIGY